MKQHSAIAPVDEGPVDLGLTSGEHAQVEQVARELAALMNLPEDPKILQAAYDILRVFVVGGRMAVPVAIDTMSRSLQMTLSRLAQQQQQH